MIERFISEVLRDREEISGLTMLTVLLLLLVLIALLVRVSSLKPGLGEGERDIDGRGEYCAELVDASKPLGRVYDRVGEGRAKFVEPMRRMLGWLDVSTDSEMGWRGVGVKENARRRVCSQFLVGGAGEEGREWPLPLSVPSSNESLLVVCRTDLRHSPRI
jgi:hypothetical protein